MRNTWYVFLIAAAVVALYVYGCIFWCVIRYRRGRSEAATFTGNPPLEIAYAVIPLILVIGLFFVTYAAEVPIDHVSAHPENRVAVTAFRWSWRFDYNGGRITNVGRPTDPPTLYLPVDRTTEVDIQSADVTHSFWIPAFLFKRDAIPGMTNVVDLTPRHLGTYLSRCAQFCGVDHALMTFVVRVIPDAAYDRYIASNGAFSP